MVGTPARHRGGAAQKEAPTNPRLVGEAEADRKAALLSVAVMTLLTATIPLPEKAKHHPLKSQQQVGVAKGGDGLESDQSVKVLAAAAVVVVLMRTLLWPKAKLLSPQLSLVVADLKRKRWLVVILTVILRMVPSLCKPVRRKQLKLGRTV
jgi:hypothetical protein